jgi:hypothetical protein
MVPSGTDPENIVNQLAGIDGVLRDDITVQEGKVTTYISKDMLGELREMEGILVEVIDESEHEYLIVAQPINS